MANSTVYPYGTGGSLPSSIGLVNDLITGGVDKALTAEQGKVIGEELYGSGRSLVDLTRYTEYPVYVNSTTSKWGSYAHSEGGYTFIPVMPGEKYQILASKSKSCGYFITQDDSHVVDTTPTYATGYSAVVIVDANTMTDEIIIPDNGNYLVFWTRSGGEARGGTLYRITDVVSDGLVDKVVAVTNTTNSLDIIVNGTGKTPVDLSRLTKYHYYVAQATGQWTYSEVIDVVFVPASPGDQFQMVASSLGTVYLLLQADSHVAGTEPSACSGCPIVTVNAGETEDITIPADGHFIAVWTKLTSGNNTPILYRITAEPVGGLNERVAELEDYRENIEFDPHGIRDNRIDYIRSIQDTSKVFSFHEQELVPSVGSHMTSYGGKLFFTKDAEKFDVQMCPTLDHKHLAFLGDSITTFANYPGSSNNYYTGSNAGVSTIYDTWWGSLTKKMDCYISRIYANGGADVQNGLCNQYNQLFSSGSTGFSPEFIFILAGINDWVHDNTLGTISDAENSNTTFYAAYKYLLKNLRITYPDANIVALTPINSMYLGTTVPYLNGNDNSIRDFCKAIIECCEYYSVPYIDLNLIINVNGGNYTNILNDYTHPNKNGMMLITRAILNNLYSITTL